MRAHPSRRRHPEGMKENSPPFQWWVSGHPDVSSPGGAAEWLAATSSFAPGGAWGGFKFAVPPLKWWAIIACPCGTRPERASEVLPLDIPAPAALKGARAVCRVIPPTISVHHGIPGNTCDDSSSCAGFPLTSGTTAGPATGRLRRVDGTATVVLPWGALPMGALP